mgnify:CR=1 FL=1
MAHVTVEADTTGALNRLPIRDAQGNPMLRIEEAAGVLGISTEALRLRLQRDKIAGRSRPFLSISLHGGAAHNVLVTSRSKLLTWDRNRLAGSE